MAKSVAEAFGEFHSNLIITNNQQEEVSRRRASVLQTLKRSFVVKDSFIFGSYQRSTAIAPLRDADVDLFVVLPSEDLGQRTPTQLLDRVRTLLSEAYSTAVKASLNGQAITIHFPDFKIDVVPCVTTRGGYLIADASNGEWILTDPRKHSDHVMDANKKHRGGLLPIIRLLKQWNRTLNYSFSGFYLELLVVFCLDQLVAAEYPVPDLLKLVFSVGEVAVQVSLDDPAGLGGAVRKFQAIQTVDQAASLFKTADSRAERALDYASRSLVPQAFEQWQSVFGNEFPKYS